MTPSGMHGVLSEAVFIYFADDGVSAAWSGYRGRLKVREAPDAQR
jgi:hypothetical protein